MSEYDEYSNESAEQDAKEISSLISKYVNRYGTKDIMLMGTELAHDHRTLVQSKMSMFQGYLRELKAQKDNGCFDMRNEAACNAAVEILNCDSMQYQLPFI